MEILSNVKKLKLAVICLRIKLDLVGREGKVYSKNNFNLHESTLSLFLYISLSITQTKMCSWVGRWMDGSMGLNAVLRISYSSQKHRPVTHYVFFAWWV